MLVYYYLRLVSNFLVSSKLYLILDDELSFTLVEEPFKPYFSSTMSQDLLLHHLKILHLNQQQLGLA